VTAVHMITLYCDGRNQRGCPDMTSIVLEARDNGHARSEASRLGWSWRWGTKDLAARNSRKKTDICPECDPERTRTR